MRRKLQDVIRDWGPLFLISCLSLFMELAVIRWVSGEIRLLAYFKNLVLLAAFLGLAIGFALVGKGRDYTRLFPWLWGIFVILILVTGRVTEKYALVYPGGGDEALWNSADLSFWLSLLVFIGIVIIFFFLVLFLFIPLGQATGEEMAKHPPVPSYVVNILASLVGVWLFSIVSYLNSPPIVWFALGLIGLGIYSINYHKFTWAVAAIFTVTLLGVGFINPTTIWSPYNSLILTPVYLNISADKIYLGNSLTVQHTFYQSAVDLSDSTLDKARLSDPESGRFLNELREAYDLPYYSIPAGSKVLVVGAGMGNDVAAAIRAKMGKIVAVEIDPAILQLGQKYHPEKPYNDPHVVKVVDDARSFFNRDKDKYDLVVFGLLDSHTLLSSLSSVRLDSYVYTIESFQQVKNHLTENGYIVLTFYANDWIKERLGRMLEEVFGQGKVFFSEWSGGTTFISGAEISDSIALQRFSVWKPNPELNNILFATDDWPYLYLRSARIPAGYWQTLLVIALLCIGMMARSFPEALKPDWHFWLLGAAFLLIEFKSITELALLFGTTWFVNSLAISGVLVMALFANLIVLKTKAINLRWIYFFLFISLILGYFFPIARLAGYNPLVKGIIGTTVLCVPLFFAGMIFSESLRRFGETSRPIASNFSGSAVGGVLEYGSIWWGIKSLYLIAIVLYLGAMLVAIRKRLLSK